MLLLGKNSIKIQPDDYITTLQVICMVQFGSYGGLSRRAPKEYTGIYRTILKNYPHDIQLNNAVELHKVLLKYLSNKNESQLEEITTLLNKISKSPDKLKPFLVSQISFIEQYIDNHDIKKAIENTISIEQSELLTQENAEKSQNYNRQGMLKFKQHDYLAAKSAFKTALVNAPSNANVALNLLQCLYKLTIENHNKQVEQATLVLCARSLEHLEPSDHRYTHSQSLFCHIKAQLANKNIKGK